MILTCLLTLPLMSSCRPRYSCHPSKCNRCQLHCYFRDTPPGWTSQNPRAVYETCKKRMRDSHWQPSWILDLQEHVESTLSHMEQRNGTGLGRFSLGYWWGTACGLLILLNALYMSQYVNDHMSQAVKRHFGETVVVDVYFRESTKRVVDMFFVVVFAFELLVRVIAFRSLFFSGCGLAMELVRHSGCGWWRCRDHTTERRRNQRREVAASSSDHPHCEDRA